MTAPSEQVKSGPDWHPAVCHTCCVDGQPNADRAIHVVLRPTHPGETPVTDIQAAGYEVLAYNVFSCPIPCDAIEGYSHCQHLIVARSGELHDEPDENGQS